MKSLTKAALQMKSDLKFRRNHLGYAFAFLAILLLLNGCSVDNGLLGSSSGVSSISGQVVPLAMGISSKNTSLNCTDNQVSLSAVNTDGEKIGEPIAITKVEPDGTFSFNKEKIKTIKFIKGEVQGNYVLELSGCSTDLSRPLTGSRNEDLSYGSLLLEWLNHSANSQKLRSSDRALLKSLMSQLASASSISDAYQRLNTSEALKDKFKTTLGIDVGVLLELPPKVSELSYVGIGREGMAQTFSVSLDHWLPSYQHAVEWRIGGQTQSTGDTFNFVPTKNSQGIQTVNVYYGQKDNLGNLDLTKPYRNASFKITVSDDYPVQSPALTLISTSPTNNSAVNLSINTGASRINCSTFSKLALTVNEITPPLFESDYNLSCDTAISQSVSANLSNQGLNTISLWARDAAGNVTNLPTTLNAYYDTVSPAQGLTSPTNNSAAMANVTLSGTCEGVLPLTISGAGLQTTVVGACSSGTFSENIVLAGADGGKSFSIAQTDVAGNTGSLGLSLTKDTVAPTVTISGPADNSFQPAGITLTGSCGAAAADNSFVTVTGDIQGAPQAANCSSGSFSKALTFTAGDGAKSVTVTQLDSVGHSTSASLNLTQDTILPAIVVTKPSLGIKGGSSQIVTWTLTETNVDAATNFLVELFNGTSWQTLASVAATSGNNSTQSYQTLPITFPSVDVTTAKLKVSLTDAAGNVGTMATTSFVIDSTAPTMTTFLVNGGNSNITSSSLPFTFSANDNLTKLMKICIQNVSTAPVSNSSCWNSVLGYGLAPALTISSSTLYYNIGLAAGSYTYYVWAMDELGNISVISNSGSGTQNVDKSIALTYTPPAPPVVSGFEVTSVDVPSTPPSSGELSVGASVPMYVRWNVSSASVVQISLKYATDEYNYNSFTGSSGFINGVNGSCTIPTGFTGCAQINSPVGAYFRLQGIFTDASGYQTFSVSNPMNSGNLRLLAGNTDLGLGGSAKSAVLVPRGEHGLAVLDDGRIFIVDVRGLGWVNPATGTFDILIRSTGTAIGDNGPVASATLQDLSGVYTDSQQNLLLTDGGKIRKVITSTNPMTISTIIGGGVDTSNTVANALNFFAPSGYEYLYVLPNQDIWFGAGGEQKMRRYIASTQQITSIIPNGTGNSFSNTQDITQCPWNRFFVTFDASSQVDSLILKSSSTVDYATGVGGSCPFGYTPEWKTYASLNPNSGAAVLPTPFTIMNNANSQLKDSGYREYFSYHLDRSGEVYGYQAGNGLNNGIFKYSKSTTNWTKIAGTSETGTCADGTPASSCAISPASIAFNAQGQLFYVDWKTKTVRTIDSDQKVQTLAGDPLGSQDGRKANTVRFTFLTDVKFWNDGTKDRFVALDYSDARIREFSPGENISTLAGNQICGIPNVANPANTESLLVCGDGNPRRISVDGSNGDVYYTSNSGVLGKLQRSSGLWQHQSTTGVYAGPVIVGTSPTHFLTANVIGAPQRISLKIMNRSTGIYADILQANSGTFAGTFCADNSPLLSCNPGFDGGNFQDSQGVYDSVTSSWIVPETGYSGRLVQFNHSGGGNLTTFGNVNHVVKGMDLRRVASDVIVYYCANDGQLYKKNLTTAVTTPLPIAVNGLGCTGPVQYIPSRSSLVFIYGQNGLTGIAEYENP